MSRWNDRAVTLATLAHCVILVSCSGPKQLYYFDRQPLVRKPDVVEYSQSSHPRNPNLLASTTTLVVTHADELQTAQAQTIPPGEPKVTVLTRAMEVVQKVEVVDDAQAPDQKPGRKKHGWIGTTSLLLILVGLPLIVNASWVAVGAGMLLTGLVLAIIAKTRKPDARLSGQTNQQVETEKSKPKDKRGTNEGAATVGLVILIVAAIAVAVLTLMAFVLTRSSR